MVNNPTKSHFNEQTTKNKETVRKYFEEILNKKNMSVAKDILTNNVVYSGLQTINGISDFTQSIDVLDNAFPDLYFTIGSKDDQIAEGNKVVTSWIMCGTHKNQFRSIQATNKRFTVSGIDVFHIATGGKIETIRAYLDSLDMMQQLGVIPQLTK
jgi:steroid delta-isomerase-like uncharacterized protein